MSTSWTDNRNTLLAISFLLALFGSIVSLALAAIGLVLVETKVLGGLLPGTHLLMYFVIGAAPILLVWKYPDKLQLGGSIRQRKTQVVATALIWFVHLVSTGWMMRVTGSEFSFVRYVTFLATLSALALNVLIVAIPKAMYDSYVELLVPLWWKRLFRF